MSYADLKEAFVNDGELEDRRSLVAQQVFRRIEVVVECMVEKILLNNGEDDNEDGDMSRADPGPNGILLAQEKDVAEMLLSMKWDNKRKLQVDAYIE